jgi:hypothetical protein
MRPPRPCQVPTIGLGRTMTDLVGICYVSSATRLMSVAELTELLVEARRFNDSVQVTGVLLHHDGGFFQYFEGPAAGTAAVYQRVRNSRRHSGITELLNQPVGERVFPRWLMGSSRVPAATALSLKQAEWHHLFGALQPSARRLPAGLALLQSFWSTVPESRAAAARNASA